MKKIFSVLVVLICVLCLSICGCYAEEDKPAVEPRVVGIRAEIYRNDIQGGQKFAVKANGDEDYDHILRCETQYDMKCLAIQNDGGSQLIISANTIELIYDAEALNIEAVDPMLDEYVVTTKTKKGETTLIAITKGYNVLSKENVLVTSTLKILIF